MITVAVIDMAIPAERDELVAMLSAGRLPTSDLEEPDRVYLRFMGDGPLGFAGIEGAGDNRLLRSVVVAPADRGVGIGRHIIAATEREAARRGARRLHLLTQDASRFFARVGYAATDRADAPPSIAATTQFLSLCPASATYMTKTIGDRA